MRFHGLEKTTKKESNKRKTAISYSMMLPLAIIISSDDVSFCVGYQFRSLDVCMCLRVCLCVHDTRSFFEFVRIVFYLSFSWATRIQFTCNSMHFI